MISLSGAASLSAEFFRSVDRRRLKIWPYRYWLIENVLSDEACRAIVALPFQPPCIGDNKGKRETHNRTRTFFSAENRRRFAVCRQVAEMLRDRKTVGKLERSFRLSLEGAFLRIEYCQDQEGFWLEPHTDIGAKLFTLQIYLSAQPGSESWGTDIYDGDRKLAATAPARFNSGLLFVPASDTWHGFRKRPINGIRKSLIVNYVKAEWRSRHELAFPDQAVTADVAVKRRFSAAGTELGRQVAVEAARSLLS